MFLKIHGHFSSFSLCIFSELCKESEGKYISIPCPLILYVWEAVARALLGYNQESGYMHVPWNRAEYVYLTIQRIADRRA